MRVMKSSQRYPTPSQWNLHTMTGLGRCSQILQRIRLDTYIPTASCDNPSNHFNRIFLLVYLHRLLDCRSSSHIYFIYPLSYAIYLSYIYVTFVSVQCCIGLLVSILHNLIGCCHVPGVDGVLCRCA